MPLGRVALLVLGAACLVAGVLGGLSRLGLALAVPNAAANHAALMTGAFLGTVISLERAIALGKPWAYGAPLAAGVGGLLLLAGARQAGLVLELAAPCFLAAVSIALLVRQRALHIALLLVAALAWAVGNAANLANAAPNATAAWWFAYLVLTIAAERLEMTRLMRRRRGAMPLFLAAAALLLGGAGASLFAPPAGGIAFGAGLLALAAWLVAFDLARRTVHAAGFPRYAAVALLAGYAWLAAGGVAWAAMSALDPAWRDAALHALGLGFVFSMILAHAPMVVPLVARRRLAYTRFFYAPLALLHASVLLRVAGVAEPALRAAGGALNAVALLLFAGTLAYALGRKTTTGEDAAPAPPPRPARG